jgi:2-oxoglutarate ferredoxin oxidoreductase subunit gamma
MNSGKKEKEQTADISIRFCGLGGMGIILSSIILGKAAIYDNKNAIQTQSYGAEQRGSKVKSDVIISKKRFINYPVIDKADILVALSQDAFEKFLSSTKKDGILLINSDLIKLNVMDRKVYSIPAMTLARELDFKKVANIIILGALVRISGVVSKESVIKSISETVREKHIAINIDAFRIGFDYFKE